MGVQPVSKPEQDDDAETATPFPTWVANSAVGWGLGYTEEQALVSLAQNVGQNIAHDRTIGVELVEHRGHATMRPIGVRVEEFVGGRFLSIEGEDFRRLQTVADEVAVAVDEAMANAEESDFNRTEDQMELDEVPDDADD